MLGSRSAYTRTRILEAAERLFAQKGHESTSLREITTEAQVNLSSVNYHFGSKEGLIQAVYLQQLDSLNQERIAMLERLEEQSGGGAVAPREVVMAFFRPLLEHALRRPATRKSFAPPVEQPLSDPNSFLSTLLSTGHDSATSRFLSALHRSLPHLPRQEILWRFQFMLGATAGAISGMDGLLFALNRKNASASDLDCLSERLTTFLAGGLLAPPPSERHAASSTATPAPDPTAYHPILPES